MRRSMWFTCAVMSALAPVSSPRWGAAELVTLDDVGRPTTGGLVGGLSDDGRQVLFLASGDLVDGPDEANRANAQMRAN